MPENDSDASDRQEDVPTREDLEAEGVVDDDAFFDTDWAQLDRDDELIDLLHSGHVEINDEAAPHEQEAADVLGRERDRVDREPLPDQTHPDAVLAEFERRQKSAEPPAPRTPESGGQPSMINEGAAILAGIAQNGEVQGAIQSAGEGVRSAAAALQQAIQTLTAQGAAAANAAGGSEGEQLNGAAQSAVGALENALSQVAMFDTDEVIEQVGVFYNAVSDAAAKHSS
jgi:hypothetical protein